MSAMKSSSKIKRRKTYSCKVMEQAIRTVKEGTPINTASKMFSIPRSSLHSKIKNKYKHDRSGPPTVFSESEERVLVKWILKMCSVGCPVTKEHLINSVSILIKKNKINNPFTNDRPGRHWYEGFLRRHPQLKIRISENVSLSRAMVSKNKVCQWFSEVKVYLEKKQLLHIHASRIFNTDETAVLLNPKGGPVLAEKGMKNVYNVVNNNEKENLTVLITGNAAGLLAPTLVMFNYKRVPSAIYANLPQDFHAGVSEKGWMTACVFYEYIANIFLPWIIKNEIQRPVILFLDGHVSHLTQALSEFCHQHQIVLVALPPNTTHFMQPMDVSFFFPFKSEWRKAVNQYRVENEVLSVPKHDVSPLIKKVFESMDLFKCLSNGFKVCGLHPFTPDAVDFSKVFLRTENREKQNTEEYSKSNIMSLAEGLETYIDTEKLKIFKGNSHADVWTGPNEDKSLFHIWKMIVNDTRAPHCYMNDCESNIQENDVVSAQNSLNTDRNIIIHSYNLTDANQNLDPLIETQVSEFNEKRDFQRDGDNNKADLQYFNKASSAEVILSNNNRIEDINMTFYIDNDGALRMDNSIELTNALQSDVLNEMKNEMKEINEDKPNDNENIIATNTDQININTENRILKDIKNLQPCTSSTVSNVPAQFKDFVFWPKEDNSKNKKRVKKCKLPSILSSEEGLRWYAEKEEGKRKVEEEKELKRKIRIENRLIKK